MGGSISGALDSFFYFKILFIHLKERERVHKQGGGAEGERSRLPAEQGAQCGTRSRDSRIMT